METSRRACRAGAAAVAAAAGHVKVAVSRSRTDKADAQGGRDVRDTIADRRGTAARKEQRDGLNRVSSHDQGTGIAPGAE